MKTIVTLHYNRPDCTKKCIEYLSNCRDIDSYNVFFFVEPCECEVLDIIKKCNLNKFIFVNDTLKGLWKNKLQAVNFAMNNSEYAIILEDDVLLSKDALIYFDWANRYFFENKEIATVTAYNMLDGEYHSSLYNQVQKRQWYNSTAWAIWKNRYELVNQWTGEDKDLMKKLHLSQNMHEVFPLLSRAQNIGFVNGVKSPAKEILKVVGIENSFATIGLSSLATTQDIKFVSDKDKYVESLKKNELDPTISKQIERCEKFNFDNQLIINELGQEYVKLDENTYKSRDNEDYKKKYYSDVWVESIGDFCYKDFYYYD